MDKKDIEFQKRIQATFRIEAEEHIHAFTAGLVELEKVQSGEKSEEIIEVMFREIHSLKGAARSVDQKDIEFLCQPLESVFSALKSKNIIPAPFYFAVFYKTSDLLVKFLTPQSTAQSGVNRQMMRELIQQLKEIAGGKSNDQIEEKVNAPENQSASLAKDFSAETDASHFTSQFSNESVRISISKLDPLLLQAEELIQSKITINQRMEEFRDLCDSFNEWKSELQKWNDRKAKATIDIWNEWSDTNEIYLNKVHSQMTEIYRSLELDYHSLDNLVNNHLEVMKQVLMLPVASLVESFPAMVRDISSEQDKEIDFIISGTELEIDKRILEELKDPLIHLIRNSIDHGIRKPQERILKNKPGKGTISLSFVAKESGMVEIILMDDGEGIDLEKVLNAATKSGIISNETANKIEPDEVIDLIYLSGISTSSIITDISGQGLGLSIVHEKIEKLNAAISTETEAGKGTTFRILIPVSLTTFRGIVGTVKEFMFILPTLNVDRVLKIENKDINTVENHETLRVDDQIISLVDLGEVIGLSERANKGSDKSDSELVDSKRICVVVLVSGEYRIAFKIDELVSEQQVMVKGLGKLLNRVKNISGATIMGNGNVVPVLNISDLIKSAMKIQGKKSGIPERQLVIPRKGKILVAEDSITSRTLIKNILETAGYQVITSVNGVDAFAKARFGNFDIIVSDVDMPKMNGFELTSKIKNDKKLSETPVVLVTALESHEDRERGIDVGADAYIIKSSFDQTNLLEIIKKLI